MGAHKPAHCYAGLGFLNLAPTGRLGTHIPHLSPPPCPLPSPPMGKITASQRKRADFLTLLLEVKTVLEAKKQLKISSTTFVRKLATKLKATANLADAPRAGRPHKYTPAMMEQAKDYVLELEDAVYSSKDLVQALVDEGILPTDSTWAGFWPVFIPYMASQGVPLVWGLQRLTFALASKHAKARLKWCESNQGIITDSTVGHYWFGDEISIEWGMHPKGE